MSFYNAHTAKKNNILILLDLSLRSKLSYYILFD